MIPQQQLVFGLLACQAGYMTFEQLQTAIDHASETVDAATGSGTDVLDFEQLLCQQFQIDDQSRAKVHQMLAELQRAPADRDLETLASTAATYEGSLDVGVSTSDGHRFRVLAPLDGGAGGMGVIHIAEDSELGRQVALKQIRNERADREFDRQKFRLEAEITGNLEHPGIVPIYSLGTDDTGRPYYAMRLVSGEDFGQEIAGFHAQRAANSANFDSVEFRSLIDRLIAVSQAVDYAHSRGVIHRDIKPSNLMLDRSGRLRILDFGLAQSNAWHLPHGDLTTVGQLLGTLDYMAPEQADTAESVDHRADIYSLGATFYCLLAGRAPYAATPRLSPLEKLRLIATEKPAALRAIRSDVPEELDQYLASLLAHDRRDRPMSAAHVAEAVAKFCNTKQLTEVTGELNKLNRLSRQSVDIAWPPTEDASNHSTSTVKNSNRNRSRRWLSSALGLLSLCGILAAAIIFAIDLNQGQLIIESEADVTVSLHKNGKPYDTIEIKPGTQTTKLFADEYQITIASGSDNVSIDNGSFVLKRGEMVVARVKSHNSTPNQESKQERPPTSSEPLYNGKTLDDCLRTVRIERDPALVGAASQGLIALCSGENREQIKNTMLEILLKLDSSRSDVRFVDENAVNVLQNILPDNDRVNLFSALLSGKDFALTNRLLIVLGGGFLPEEYIRAIGSHLTTGTKEHYPETFKRATDKIVNQLARFRSVSASEQLLQSQALDADFWLSVDWIGLRRNGDYPQRFTDALIKRCMSIVRLNRCDASYCMALRQLYGWRNSPKFTDSFLNEITVLLDSAAVKDNREFVSIENVQGPALHEGLLAESPRNRQHVIFSSERNNRSSTAVLSILHFLSGLERPIPQTLADRVRKLEMTKRDATSDIENWENVLVKVQWPEFVVMSTFQPRNKNLALVKSIRERPASFWYDALVYQAAYTVLSRQVNDSGVPANEKPSRVPKPKEAKKTDKDARPPRPSKVQDVDNSREITYAGKTLTQCLDTIRWERQPEQLDAAFKGMRVLATDQNRERIAKVIVETIPKVDGARQRVGDSAFDRVAIRNLEAILPRERFNEAIKLLLNPERPKLAMRIVQYLSGTAEIDALNDIARLIDVPECSEQAARSLASLMTHSDIDVRDNAARYLTDAKTKTFWPMINWNRYLTPSRYPQDHYPQSLIDRIAVESAEVISTADEYDHAFCGACINLAYWAKSTPFEEEFLSSLARHVKALAGRDAVVLVETPAFAAFEAMPTRRVSFPNRLATHLRMDRGERTYLTNPLFAVLSLVRAIDQPLPNDLRDCLQELAASDSLQDVEQVILLRSRFSWPRLNQRVQKRSPVFWHQYFAAREAKIILAKREESAKAALSDEKP